MAKVQCVYVFALYLCRNVKKSLKRADHFTLDKTNAFSMKNVNYVSL